MVHLDQIFLYLFYHFPATGMKKGDEASPSIIFAGRALLVKMLITLEPDGIFGSNFVYFCIFNMAQPLICKKVKMLIPLETSGSFDTYVF